MYLKEIAYQYKVAPKTLSIWLKRAKIKLNDNTGLRKYVLSKEKINEIYDKIGKPDSFLNDELNN